MTPAGLARLTVPNWRLLPVTNLINRVFMLVALASLRPYDRALDQYRAALERDLLPEMAAGRRLLAAFSRHPGAFHTGLATAKGWRIFTRFCRSEATWQALVGHRQARLALSLLSLA